MSATYKHFTGPVPLLDLLRSRRGASCIYELTEDGKRKNAAIHIHRAAKRVGARVKTNAYLMVGSDQQTLRAVRVQVLKRGTA